MLPAQREIYLWLTFYGTAEKGNSVWRNAVGGSKGVCPFGRRAKLEKGRQRAKRT